MLHTTLHQHEYFTLVRAMTYLSQKEWEPAIRLCDDSYTPSRTMCGCSGAALRLQRSPAFVLRSSDPVLPHSLHSSDGSPVCWAYAARLKQLRYHRHSYYDP